MLVHILFNYVNMVWQQSSYLWDALKCFIEVLIICEGCMPIKYDYNFFRLFIMNSDFEPKLSFSESFKLIPILI